MSKKQQTLKGTHLEDALLFVDTNIFLDFYRAGSKAGLTLLKHLEAQSLMLIMTDQLEVEFLNNRQKVISLVLENLKLPNIPPFTPSYLADSKTAAAIERNLSAIRKRIDSLKDRFARILKNPTTHDPVYHCVQTIMARPSGTNLRKDHNKYAEIVSLARNRYERGFPPRKKQDHSIGDAINWEWILDCASLFRANVLIVSRDTDFGINHDGTCYLNDWLKQEFRERVSSKRSAELSPSLTQALKQLAVPITAAEEKEEQAIIQASAAGSSTSTGELAGFMADAPWAAVMDRIKAKSVFLHTYLKELASAKVQGTNLTLTFAPSCMEYIDLVNNPKTCARICEAMNEAGFPGEWKVVFGKVIPPPQSPEPPPVASDEDEPF